MTDERSKELRGIVNASGFIFQLAVAFQILKNKDKHGWEILSYEHPWRYGESGADGFIDLILRNDRLRLVVECKRTTEKGSWIFLNPDTKHDSIIRTRCLWTNLIDNSLSIKTNTGSIFNQVPLFKKQVVWSDFAIEIESPESEFCVVRGKGDNDKPLLERISGQLVTQCECLAAEELTILENNKCPGIRTYIPVIVTNAHLEICHFDPEEISLLDGNLSKGKFETVPIVRFKKSLTTRPSTNPCLDLRDAMNDKERTIFVINAEYLCDILPQIHIDKLDKFNPWPWDIY